MKTFFIILLLQFTLFAAHIDDFAKEMNFQRDYKTALQKAKVENKLLVMVLSADYCPWCRKFENKTLTSSLVKPRLNKETVTLMVDKKFDVESFPAKYKTQFTPLVFFINPNNEEILDQSVGYVKKNTFMKTLNDAQKLYKEAQ